MQRFETLDAEEVTAKAQLRLEREKWQARAYSVIKAVVESHLGKLIDRKVCQLIRDVDDGMSPYYSHDRQMNWWTVVIRPAVGEGHECKSAQEAYERELGVRLAATMSNSVPLNVNDNGRGYYDLAALQTLNPGEEKAAERITRLEGAIDRIPGYVEAYNHQLQALKVLDGILTDTGLSQFIPIPYIYAGN